MIRLFPHSRSTSLAALPLSLALSLAACGAEGPDFEQSPIEETGSIGLELDVGTSVRLHSVSWEVTGNGVSRSGTFNVRDSTKIAGIVGGIPAGQAYTIALSAADTRDSNLRCIGC